jgi:hypothetical protein
MKILEENPLDGILWIPSVIITKSDTLCWFIVVFFQLIPSAVLYGILKLIGKKSP